MQTNLQDSFHPRSPLNKICHPSPCPNSSDIPITICVKGTRAETDSIELANTWTHRVIFCSAFQRGVVGTIMIWSSSYAFPIQPRHIFCGADWHNLESPSKLDWVAGHNYLKLAQGHCAITPGWPQPSCYRLPCIHNTKGSVSASLDESLMAFYFNSFFFLQHFTAHHRPRIGSGISPFSKF